MPKHKLCSEVIQTPYVRKSGLKIKRRTLNLQKSKESDIGVDTSMKRIDNFVYSKIQTYICMPCN